MMGKASRDAGQQSCNFVLSALANLVVVLAKLTITLGQEKITGMDGRIIDEGLIRAERRRRNCGTRARERPFGVPPPCRRSRRGSVT